MPRKYTMLLTTLILAMIFVGNVTSPILNTVTGANTGASIEITSSDVYVGIDLAHDSELIEDELDNLKTLVGNNFAELVEITNPFTKSNLQGGGQYVDVLLIIAPTVNYTDNEITTLVDFINKGNSILFAGTANKNVSIVLNTLTDNLNLSVTFDEATAPNFNQAGENQPTIQLYDFNTPRIPAVENVTSFLFYNGTELHVDGGTIEAPEGGSLLKDHYSVIDNPNTENSLVYAIEFKSTLTEHTLASRFLFSGSAMMFSDKFIEPAEETGLGIQDNTELLLGSLNWLSKIAGRFTYSDLELIDTPERILIGTLVRVKVNVTNYRGEAVDNAKISLTLEQAGSVPVKSQMVLKEGLYYGNISTDTLHKGWHDVRVTAERRGYLTLETDAIKQDRVQIFIDLESNLPQLTNISFFAAFAVMTTVVVVSAIFIYKDVRKFQ
ncbi:MAG: hypothetical protein ACFFD4_12240 [Candidatus Odinarchaeota archaeon]